jgi:hypothetical protein
MALLTIEEAKESLLLDECIDQALRHGMVGHDCQTCRYAGLKGLTNGRLLAAAEQADFEPLITVDQNMQYQQSLRAYCQWAATD